MENRSFKLLLLPLFILLLSSFASAAYTNYYMAQFEDISETTATYWTASGGGAFTPTQSSTAYNGTYSLGASVAGGSNARHHDMNYDGTIDGINVSFWVRRVDNGDMDIRLASNSAYGDQIGIGLASGTSTTKFSHNDGGWTATSADFNTNTWYNVNFLRNGANIELYVDGALVHTVSRSGKDMSYFMTLQNTITANIDNIIVYTGTIPEPTGPENFEITSKNLFNDSSIQTFRVDINESPIFDTVYQTTNGTIITNIYHCFFTFLYFLLRFWTFLIFFSTLPNGIPKNQHISRRMLTK